MLVITKTQQADNHNRNKRSTLTRDKAKKQQQFNKILAAEMTRPPKR